MPAIKRVDYLYHADLKENQRGRLSDFQKFHLWRYVWQELPNLFFSFLIATISVISGVFLLLDGTWESHMAVLFACVPSAFFTIPHTWYLLINSMKLLSDFIYEDIMSIEGIAEVDYKGCTSVKGVKLSQYIDDQPRLFDGRLYRVYYLRRSKAFLTYEELIMKRKES